MKFVDAIEKEIYKVLTENGDIAYESSGSYCLDFFSLIGAMRDNYQDLLNLFLKAYYEDTLLTIKILFYARDIRGGLGERNSFRMLFGLLCNLYPNIAKQLITFVPAYGRYDDLLIGLNTPIENDVISFIKDQLTKDFDAINNHQKVSLLGKWLPSINTSSEITKNYGRRLCKLLGYKQVDYRKLLSKLRKGIIENNLREKNYTFNYQQVPSQAFFKYQKAFMKHDNERYTAFLDEVNRGNTTLNTKTLFPYQIVRKILSRKITDSEKSSYNTMWNNLPLDTIDSNTIVVMDGSGSMYDGISNIQPINIAMSLAILFASKLKGSFKDTFITFSEKPKLVKLNNGTIFDKVNQLLNCNEIGNTDINKVYQLILDVANKYQIPKEEMITRIVIISDMEFDAGVSGVPNYEVFRDAFNKTGYNFPEVVFWNVEARSTHLPVNKDETNVKLVSGSSIKIIESIINNTAYNPYDYMIEVLSKYQELDIIKL